MGCATFVGSQPWIGCLHCAQHLQVIKRTGTQTVVHNFITAATSGPVSATSETALHGCHASNRFVWSGQVTRADSSNIEPPLKRAGKRRVQPYRHPPVACGQFPPNACWRSDNSDHWDCARRQVMPLSISLRRLGLLASTHWVVVLLEPFPWVDPIRDIATWHV